MAVDITDGVYVSVKSLIEQDRLVPKESIQEEIDRLPTDSVSCIVPLYAIFWESVHKRDYNVIEYFLTHFNELHIPVFCMWCNVDQIRVVINALRQMPSRLLIGCNLGVTCNNSEHSEVGIEILSYTIPTGVSVECPVVAYAFVGDQHFRMKAIRDELLAHHTTTLECLSWRFSPNSSVYDPYVGIVSDILNGCTVLKSVTIDASTLNESQALEILRCLDRPLDSVTLYMGKEDATIKAITTLIEKGAWKTVRWENNDGIHYADPCYVNLLSQMRRHQRQQRGIL